MRLDVLQLGFSKNQPEVQLLLFVRKLVKEPDMSK